MPSQDTYYDAEEWQWITEQAEERGTSVSRVVRGCVRQEMPSEKVEA